MGNITLLDMLGAALIAGFLLLIVYHANARMNETLFTTGNDLVVQERLVDLVGMIEKDMRRIGYCRDQRKIADQSRTITAAGASSIAFLTDVDHDGVVDTVSWHAAAPSSMDRTPNPRDRALHRMVNGAPDLPMNVGLTGFHITYYNAAGDTMLTPVADPTLIHGMDLALRLESPWPYNGEYTFAAWRQLRMKTRNLATR